MLGAFDGRWAWIDHLAVADPFRRRAIGRLLMEAAERCHNLQVAACNQVLGYKAADNRFMEKPLVTLTPPDGALGEIV